jgi:hypothetical protein
MYRTPFVTEALCSICDYCYFPSLLQLAALPRGAPMHQARKQIIVSCFTDLELHDAEQRILISNKLYGSFKEMRFQMYARYSLIKK